jgi:hypothetical protein
MTKITFHDPPKKEFTLADIPTDSIVAISADWSGKQKKYLLTPYGNEGACCFTHGNGCWNLNESRERLLEFCMRDDRVTIHVFTDLTTLATWLLN